MAANGEVKLGDRVKHKIHGFQGIATGITEYVQQCRQVLITPEKLKDDGDPIQGHWYDEPWVDIVKAAVHKPIGAVMDNKGRTSGAPDRPHPPAERR